MALFNCVTRYAFVESDIDLLNDSRRTGIIDFRSGPAAPAPSLAVESCTKQLKSGCSDALVSYLSPVETGTDHISNLEQH